MTEYIPKTEKGIKKKELIYNETLKLFNSKGFEKTTLNDICTANGIAMGTFYHYYQSKESILLEYFSKMGRKLETHYEDLECRSPYDTLKSVINYQIELLLQGDRNLLGKFPTIELESTDDMSRSQIFPLKSIIEEILQVGFDRGDFSSDLPSDYIAFLIMAVFIGVFTTWTSRGRHYDLKSHLNNKLQPLFDFITRNLP